MRSFEASAWPGGMLSGVGRSCAMRMLIGALVVGVMAGVAAAQPGARDREGRGSQMWGEREARQGREGVRWREGGGPRRDALRRAEPRGDGPRDGGPDEPGGIDDEAGGMPAAPPPPPPPGRGMRAPGRELRRGFGPGVGAFGPEMWGPAARGRGGRAPCPRGGGERGWRGLAPDGFGPPPPPPPQEAGGFRKRGPDGRGDRARVGRMGPPPPPPLLPLRMRPDGPDDGDGPSGVAPLPRPERRERPGRAAPVDGE
jgi:hypothetical protein